MIEEFEARAAAAGVEPVDAYVKALMAYTEALAFRIGYFYLDYLRHSMLQFCDTAPQQAPVVRQLTHAQAVARLSQLDVDVLRSTVMRLRLHVGAASADPPTRNHAVHLANIMSGDPGAIVVLPGFTLSNLDVIPGTLEIADRRAKPSNICLVK
jgi:hypothetical protein